MLSNHCMGNVQDIVVRSGVVHAQTVWSTQCHGQRGSVSVAYRVHLISLYHVSAVFQVATYKLSKQ